jgi:hypothetical protein
MSQAKYGRNSGVRTPVLSTDVRHGTALAPLIRHPWRALGALAALALAAFVAIGSGASFTAATVNPNNVFSAGILHISANPSGAILNASDLKPGDSATGQVTITNDGTVDGNNWQLSQAITTETQGTDPDNPQSHGNLSSKLNLKVEDLTANQTVYNGDLASLSQASIPTISKGAANGHNFKFTVTFPGGGSNDNQYEGGSLTAKYTWSASAGS